jgi:hypothetical protein
MRIIDRSPAIVDPPDGRAGPWGCDRMRSTVGADGILPSPSAVGEAMVFLLEEAQLGSADLLAEDGRRRRPPAGPALR